MILMLAQTLTRFDVLSTHGSFGWECLKTWPVSANSALATNASFVGFTTGKKLHAFIESSTGPNFSQFLMKFPSPATHRAALRDGGVVQACF
jgi:hypothetical protein